MRIRNRPQTPTERPGWPLLLLVEDDAGVSLAVRRALEELRIAYVSAPNVCDARQALLDATFLETPLNALLADFDLPDGTGCEVVHAFRTVYPKAPAALMSGSADIQETGWMHRERVLLLPKPFLKDELRRWLRLLPIVCTRPVQRMSVHV